MDERYSWDKIDRQTFDDLLAQYSDVLPQKLVTLDEQRYSDIPATVRGRKDDAHLTKDEALTLVNWKLSHGRFRPTLKALLQQNSEETVVSTTREAFSVYHKGSAGLDALKSSIEILTKLRGIGPATASLFLSVYDPPRAPFFAVGIFGWAMGKKGHGREWEQGIKYNLKEYLELAERVAKFTKRLDVSAAEAEKAGYVLGHTVVGKVPTVAPYMEKSTKEKKGKRPPEGQDQSNEPPPPSKRTAKRLKTKP